jgi:hypothetical protein
MPACFPCVPIQEMREIRVPEEPAKEQSEFLPGVRQPDSVNHAARARTGKVKEKVVPGTSPDAAHSQP